MKGQYGVTRFVNHTSGEIEIQLDTGEWVETTCNPADLQDLKADDIVYVWKNNNKIYFQIEEV